MPVRAIKKGGGPDKFLAAVILILVVFGLTVLASASSELGKTRFNDSYYYIKHQLMNGASFGTVGLLIGYFIYYQRWKKVAFPILLLGLVALSLVFTHFGVQAKGANRWVSFGPISFQPGEFMKFAFLVYLAAWLSNAKTDRTKNFTAGLLPFLLVSGIIAVLFLLEPATSTMAILLLSGLAVYFVSGARLKYLATVGVLSVVILAAVVYLTPYRRARILTFLNPNADAQGQSYQINQALIAIGSGGLSGVGYGRSATKASYLPAPIDDSIFAVIGEELGFLGTSAIVTLFSILVLRLFWLAKEVRDNFGRFLLVGFGSLIALQSLVNMSAISGIIPLTGIPLPFVSFGGTSLAVFLTMSGIALNISRYV